MKSVYEQIREDKIIAIVRGVSAEIVVNIAEALYAGGIKLLEITCNTTGVMDIIKEVSAAMEGRMLVGAGTVINSTLAEQVHRAGAKYMLAPDVNPDVIRYCVDNNIAVIPGAMTATEILTAWRSGAEIIKLFPAGALGAEYVRQIRGPIDNIDLLAVGGVDQSNISELMTAGCIGAGLGGSLVKKSLVEQHDWEALQQLACEYVKLAN